MHLALDFGNSFVKAGLFEEDRLQLVKRFKTEDHEGLITFLKNHSIEAGIFASVIELPVDLREFLTHQLALLELTNKTALPVQVAYETPETLGIDRIASVVAARKLQPSRPVLAIDTGTCITYDFVTAEGVYSGGAISPGFQMRFKALNAFTGRLPLVSAPEEKTVALTGLNTETSILSGVCNGIVHEVDGFIAAYRKKNDDLAVVVGGGDTHFFEKNLKNPIFAKSNLVLIGLNEILKFNASH